MKLDVVGEARRAARNCIVTTAVLGILLFAMLFTGATLHEFAAACLVAGGQIVLFGAGGHSYMRWLEYVYMKRETKGR